MENKMYFVEQKDPEFNYMFSLFPDPVMYNEEWRESLQYMGTVLFANGELKHQFRHRAEPKTNLRKYWNIDVSPSFRQRVKMNQISFR